MKPFLRNQLERYAQRHGELDFLLSREDIMKDMEQFLKLSREHTDVSAVASRWARKATISVQGLRRAYLVREGRLAVVDSLKVESPKTKPLAAKFKAMNLESVMVIADEVDENLYLASRNLVNVLVVEPRYADPVSLVHYRKVLVTKAAMDKLKEMFA